MSRMENHLRGGNPTIEVEVRGIIYQVRVTRDGEFVTEFGDDTLRSPTLDGLKALLDRAAKRHKIEPIPFLHWTGERLRSGKVHGVRANSSHLVVTYDDEKKPTQEWSLDGTVSPEFESEYRILCDMCVKAEELRRAFEKERGFNVREEIERRSQELPGAKGGAA
jgi:hypothetical protein